jgi:hypothetical protein
VFLSLPASEVEKVVTLEAEPPAAEKLAPGGMVYVGPALHGPGYDAPPAPPPSSGSFVDPYAYGYGYSDSYWGGGYVPNPRPPSPPPFAPSRIGPNGFPIIAPPGTPGSVPPPIGPNGYPILAPPPVRVQPLTPRR